MGGFFMNRKGTDNMSTMSILSFGADPSGKLDSTMAIQQAIDRAAMQGGGIVEVPAGRFLCADLKMKTGVTLQGCASWGYKRMGGCILMLNSSKTDATCLVDLTGAYACTLRDLTISGSTDGWEKGAARTDGSGIHGVYLSFPALGPRGGKTEEDIPTLINCKVCGFSGDAVHYHNVWCFRIQHCQLAASENGLSLCGVDGFILDTWFSANRRWGIHTEEDAYNSSVIVTGCRVEWNEAGGFYVTGARNWQITANSFDRNFGPAVHLDSNHSRIVPFSNTINLTGNNFNRSGVGREGDAASHLVLSEVYNVSVTGNTFMAGAGDDYQGEVTPKYSIVARALKSAAISGNALHNGSTEKVLLDHGGHYEKRSAEDPLCGLRWEANPGCTTLPACYAVPGYFLSMK